MDFSDDDWIDIDEDRSTEFNIPISDGDDEDGWGGEFSADELDLTKIDRSDFDRIGGKTTGDAFTRKISRGVVGTITDAAAGIVVEKYPLYEKSIQSMIDTMEDLDIQTLTVMNIKALVPAILFYKNHIGTSGDIEPKEFKQFIKKTIVPQNLLVTMIKYIRMLMIR